MKNTRLIYIATQQVDLDYPHIIEKIDNCLDQSKYLKIVNNDIFLYGQKGESELKVGREIYGREEDAYHSETFKLCDFTLSEERKEEVISFDHLENLLGKIKEIETSFESFRIQLKLAKPNQAAVLFF